MKIWNWAKSIFKEKEPESLDVHLLASGPVPEGALSIHLASGIEPPLYLSDIDLSIPQDLIIDLGSLYTQKQINDSNELKRRILDGSILFTTTGTIPSLERATIAGISLTVPAIVGVVDPSNSNQLHVNSDGSINVDISSEPITTASRPLYYAFDGNQDAETTDILYDFNGEMQDIFMRTDQSIIINWNSLGNPAVSLTAGQFDFDNQFARKIYITTGSELTHIQIYGNGGVA